MASQTPLVLVFQRLASATVTAATPTLQSLVAGPCYHIQDYPADASSIGIGAYGTLTGDNDALNPLFVTGIPAEGGDALIVADPPNNVLGATLDQDSVVIYGADARVVVTTGTTNGTFSAAPADNVFSVTGTNFGASGVLPGDRLVVTDPAGPTTVARTILEVGGVQGSTLATNTLSTTSNYAAAGTDINGDVYAGAALTGLDWRIERTLASPIEIDPSFIEFSANETTLKGGVTHATDITGDGVDDVLTVAYANLYMAYRSLRQDLARVTQVTASNVSTELGRNDERNPLRVAAGLALANAGNFPIYTFGVTGDDLNGGSDTAAAYATMYELLESQEDLFAIAPMTFNSTVIGNGVNHVNAFSAPEKAKFRVLLAGQGPIPTTKLLGASSVVGQSEQVAGDTPSVLVSSSFDLVANGVRANDTLFITDDDDSGTKEGSYKIDRVFDADRLRSTELGDVGADTTSNIQYWIFRGANGTVSRATVGSVVSSSPNDVELSAGLGKSSDVGKVIRLVSKVSGGSAPTDNNASPTGDNHYLITAVAGDTYTVVGGAWTPVASESLNIEIVNTLESSGAAAVSATDRQPFRQLLDNTATFVSSGVVVSDSLQVPVPAVSAGTSFVGTLYAAPIAAVVSNERIRLAATEDLPTTNLVTGQSDIGYRVQRSLDRPGQVAELQAVVDESGGYNEKRLYLMLPDEVTLADVVDARTGLASRQPGYYMAAVVAGMSAGLPPQQGLTNLGVTGVSEIHNSSRYFTQQQLEDISNAGYFLFVQPTTSQAPYIIHQLSTDTSSLLTSEFSMVRCLDYVSRYLKDILDDFIGRYNVNQETLELLQGSLESGIDFLRSAKLPKIGAPLIDGTIVRLVQSPSQTDSVEADIDVEIPSPLNRIRLTLTA